MPQKEAQRVELPGRHRDEVAAHAPDARDRIQLNVAPAQEIVRRQLGVEPDSAELRFYTRDYLGWTEGFHHVVIGAGVEASNAVRLLAARGQQDNRGADERLT